MATRLHTGYPSPSSSPSHPHHTSGSTARTHAPLERETAPRHVVAHVGLLGPQGNDLDAALQQLGRQDTTSGVEGGWCHDHEAGRYNHGNQGEEVWYGPVVCTAKKVCYGMVVCASGQAVSLRHQAVSAPPSELPFGGLRVENIRNSSSHAFGSSNDFSQGCPIISNIGPTLVLDSNTKKVNIYIMYIFLAVGVIHDHLPPSIVQDCSIENKRHAHQSRRWKKGPPPPRSTRPTSPSLARWSRSRARCRSRRSTRRAARSGGAERAPAPQRRAPPPPRGSSEERSIKRTHRRVKAWGVLFSVGRGHLFFGFHV